MPQRNSGRAGDPCPDRARASAPPCIRRLAPTRASTIPRRERSLERVTSAATDSEGAGVEDDSTASSRGPTTTSDFSGLLRIRCDITVPWPHCLSSWERRFRPFASQLTLLLAPRPVMPAAGQSMTRVPSDAGGGPGLGLAWASSIAGTDFPSGRSQASLRPRLPYPAYSRPEGAGPIRPSPASRSGPPRSCPVDTALCAGRCLIATHPYPGRARLCDERPLRVDLGRGRLGHRAHGRGRPVRTICMRRRDDVVARSNIRRFGMEYPFGDPL